MNTTDVAKQGFLRRLKTLKRRYFVLRTTSAYGKPRLEYYESEKKLRTNGSPKRVIQLASCLNIAQKDEPKHQFVFALYTREDVFGLICESSDELQSWLEALTNQQKISESCFGNEYSSNNVDNLPPSFPLRQEIFPSRPHVSSWPVTVKSRGLGTSKSLAGSYHLTLTNQMLSLIRSSSEELVAEFHLTSVRRCGHTDCFFFMEIGRSSVTGAGEIWMQVEDAILAHHLHDVILLAMQGVTPDSSSPSRYRCHSGGVTNRQRPTSLLLSPSRNRSDTLPDSSQDNDAAVSPTKHDPRESSPAGSKKSAMFQRLMSVGKRKTSEDPSPRLFSRRTQSKSLSIDPCQGGLLGRAQSMDFSKLFHDVELLSTPITLDSPNKEIDFEMSDPARTSSTSSGSSARSGDLPHSPRTPSLHEFGRRDSDTLTPSPRTPEATDEGYDSTLWGDTTPRDEPTARDSCALTDDGTLKREEKDRHDSLNETIQTNESTNEPQQSRASRSGYEDMSSLFENLTIEESMEDEDMDADLEGDKVASSLLNATMPAISFPNQVQTTEPIAVVKNQGLSPLQQLTPQLQPSPKQRRTSDHLQPSQNEFRELVLIKSSPSSSPRRSRNSLSSSITSSEIITEDVVDSPSSSPRRRRGDEYVQMALVQTESHSSHSYMNITYSGTEAKDSPAYMNIQPGNVQDNKFTVEEHDYMNINPGEVSRGETENEFPSYMNFSPGNFQSNKTKHTYENVNLNGTETTDSHDYMNFSPRRHSGDHVTSSKIGLPSSPARSSGGMVRRRESEPATGKLISDEKTGMLLLDFSKKSKPKKVLNYISLDLSRNKKKSDSMPRARPTGINTSECRRAMDPGPKSAPLETGYAEIDFNRSDGLRQAIIDHEKTKI